MIALELGTLTRQPRVAERSAAPACRSPALDWPDIYERLVCNPNDPLAWDLLQRRIGTWAHAALRDRAEHVIEDVVEDTCAAVAIGLGIARGPETFGGFVYGRFLTERRRALQLNRVKLTPIDGIDIEDESEDDDPPGAEHLALLREAIRELPDREREALVLRYQDSASASEIGAAMGISPGYARLLVHQGLKRLRQHFRSRCATAASSTT
jgi:RNA polymerase sigma-70 factor (ECF subfamily)